MIFFILWYQARKAKAASCRELTELLKKKAETEDEAKRAREAAAREREGLAREKAKMEKEAQEERDSLAREQEKCSTELRAAARQNRKMATALLQVPVLIAESLCFFQCCGSVIFWYGSSDPFL